MGSKRLNSQLELLKKTEEAALFVISITEFREVDRCDGQPHLDMGDTHRPAPHFLVTDCSPPFPPAILQSLSPLFFSLFHKYKPT